MHFFLILEATKVFSEAMTGPPPKANMHLLELKTPVFLVRTQIKVVDS